MKVATPNEEDKERARLLVAVINSTGAFGSDDAYRSELAIEFAEARLKEREKIVEYLREFWKGTWDDDNLQSFMDKLAELIEKEEHLK